jgi:hypothetical protein
MGTSLGEKGHGGKGNSGIGLVSESTTMWAQETLTTMFLSLSMVQAVPEHQKGSRQGLRSTLQPGVHIDSCGYGAERL